METAGEMAGTTAGTTTSGSDSTTSMGSHTDTGFETSTSTSTTDTDTDPTTEGGFCGDGTQDVGEACDFGDKNGLPGSTCTEMCTIAESCGNGTLDVGEECDDDNNMSGDGCSPDCKVEPAMPVCGDGEVNQESEDCDDGNDDDNDGCTNDCKLPEEDVEQCGDGVIQWPELCDGDDDCTDTCIPSLKECASPLQYKSCDDSGIPPLTAPFRAIGLGCVDYEYDYPIPVYNANLTSTDKGAWRIAEQFGSYVDGDGAAYGATEGSHFLALSTGTISPPKKGIITEAPSSQASQGNNNNPDFDMPPPGVDPSMDAAKTLQAFWEMSNNPNDRIILSFRTAIPPGAQGYSIDFAFLSSEWPKWVGTEYSDLLLIWQVNEGWTGTVSTIGNEVLSTTSMHHHWSSKPLNGKKTCNSFGSSGPGYSCDEPQLENTGFEGHAGSTWLRANHDLGAGETLGLIIFLADMGDSAQSSVALIDNFRYRCEGCLELDHPACISTTPSQDCCGVVMPTK